MSILLHLRETCFLTMLLHSSLKSQRDLYSQPRSSDMSGVLKLSLPQDKGLDRLGNSWNSATPAKTSPSGSTFHSPCLLQYFSGNIWQPGMCWKSQASICTRVYATQKHTHTHPLHSKGTLCYLIKSYSAYKTLYWFLKMKKKSYKRLEITKKTP